MRKLVFLTVVLAFCLFSSANATDYNLSVNLTHYFDYSSDVNLADRINTSLVGAFSAGVSTVAGKLGNAVHFTGSQRVGFSAAPNLLSVFTLSYWHKMNGYDSSGGVIPIDNNAGQLVLYDAGGSFKANIGGDGYTTLTEFDGVVNDNTWHMVTIVRNNTDLYVYVDGNYWKKGTLGDNVAFRFNDLQGWRDDAGYDFIGDFDDFAIWKSRLSAPQIKFLYNNGTGRNLTKMSNLTFQTTFPNLTITNIKPVGETFSPVVFLWTLNHTAGCDFYYDSDLNLSTVTNMTTTFNFTLTNGTHTYSVNCTDSHNKKANSGTITFKVVNKVAEVLGLNSCPNTTSGVGVAAILTFICLVLVFLGFLFRIGIIGVFGSLMMFPLSWSFVACNHLFGYLLALCGMALFFVFAVLMPSRVGLWG